MVDDPIAQVRAGACSNLRQSKLDHHNTGCEWCVYGTTILSIITVNGVLEVSRQFIQRCGAIGIQSASCGTPDFKPRHEITLR